MELTKFDYKPKLNPKARKPNVLLEQIRDLLGNKVKKINGNYVELDRKWTYEEIIGYIGDVPHEWLPGFYSASVDAEVPARHFCALIKQARLKPIK